MSQPTFDKPSAGTSVTERTRTALRRVSETLRPFVPESPLDAVEVIVFLTLLATILVAGYVQGTMTVVVGLPTTLGVGNVAILQAVVACLTLSTLFSASVVTFFGQTVTDADGELPVTGPTVTAVVPVHRDAGILHRSVESLLDSRYTDLQILVVAEPGDRESIARAREYTEHDRVDLLINTRYAGTKAGAINHAAEVTDTEYLAVFDADERVDPRFVSAAVDKLADCDVVQGRTVPEPTGVVETVAYYESVVLGDLSQRLLTLVTDFRTAASRTVVMRRDAFETVGGYDPAMLTEDYAFAFACYEAGLDVVEQHTYCSTIEAAHTLTDWWGQRKRWMTGYVQVLHELVTGCRRPTNYRSLVSPLVCAGSVFGNLFMFSLVSKAAVLVAESATAWLALPLFALVGSGLAMRLYDAHAGQFGRVGVGWLAMPIILPLYSLVGIKAAIEYVLTWDGEWYSVAKGAGS